MPPPQNHEIHLWTIGPDAITAAPDALPLAGCPLSPEEKDRLQRFHFAKDRRLYLLSHVLLRQTLSHYLGIPPDELRFIPNSWGKPFLPPGQNTADLDFNLSHTSTFIALAIRRGGPIGVDVERLDRQARLLDICERFFSPTEAADLRAAPSEQQPRLFFQYWTLKESYIKARGKGLSLPLDQFTIRLQSPEKATVSFPPQPGDTPEAWHFRLLHPGPEHLIALCVKTLQPELIQIHHHPA
ncbi:MAG: 4'-phosphopantetheinyl transferase superfamily protein [Verrucomicrobiae bacterium]|nr:4'-phosphopantetheinyl transferase superfamily protein [Verrucomicrobiae bacterium]